MTFRTIPKDRERFKRILRARQSGPDCLCADASDCWYEVDMPEPLPDCIPYSPLGAHIYPKAFYSVPEAASLLGMTHKSLRTMLKDGLIRALCIHNAQRYRYRIPAAEIVRLLTPLSPRGK